jgi:molecular chaperone GrpE
MNENNNIEEEAGEELLGGQDEPLVISDPRDFVEEDDSQPNIYVLGEELPQASMAGDLEAARQLAAEYLDIAQRTRAELINFRKRVDKERNEYQRHAIEDLVIDLLPCLESLEQAIQIFQDVKEGENPLLDGMRKTRNMLYKVLTKHGAEAINQPQVPFDPNMHMPLMTEESAEVEAPFVSEVYQQGIRVGDRVVKPAMVKVLVPPGKAGEVTRGEGAGE